MVGCLQNVRVIITCFNNIISLAIISHALIAQTLRGPPQSL